MMANRSMMPKKEVTYSSGFLMLTKRRIYSKVNKAVNTHSSIKKVGRIAGDSFLYCRALQQQCLQQSAVKERYQMPYLQRCLTHK